MEESKGMGASLYGHPAYAGGPTFKVNPHALLGSTMNEIGVRMGASLYGHTPDGAGRLSK